MVEAVIDLSMKTVVDTEEMIIVEASGAMTEADTEEIAVVSEETEEDSEGIEVASEAEATSMKAERFLIATRS